MGTGIPTKTHERGQSYSGKNEIGATEAAPMINAALKTPSSVVECTFIEEHSFQKNSKNFKFFLRRNIECTPLLLQ